MSLVSLKKKHIFKVLSYMLEMLVKILFSFQFSINIVY